MKHLKAVYSLMLVIFIGTGCQQEDRIEENLNTTQSSDITPEDEIFYHVFQRSFYDSNSDGHGDLRGFTSKLDYLQDLGITSILMTPLYQSIFYHNYFADDFEGIDEEFGTSQDYFNMISAIHARGMKFYMDMEVQYVTKDHVWFGESFENPASEFSEYVIYNGPGNTDPETIIFDLSRVESYNGEAVECTTVNLSHQGVKTYLANLFKYWVDPNEDGSFEDGVDGFRIDHMMDDLDDKGILTDLLAGFWAPLISELKAVNPEIQIIAEQSHWDDLGTSYFTNSDVDIMFAFTIRNAITSFNRNEVINAVSTTDQATPDGKYQLIFLENHDLDRYATVVEADPAKLRLGPVLTFFSKGIPLIYYGQELGMKGSGGFGKYGNTDANDIPRREAFEWHETVEGDGMALWYKNSGPWWDATNLKDNDGISFEEQSEDPGSLYNFYRDLIELRKSNEALSHGNQLVLANSHDNIVTLARWNDNAAFLVALNTSNQAAKAVVKHQEWPFEINSGSPDLIIGNGSIVSISESDALELSIPEYGYALWRWK